MTKAVLVRFGSIDYEDPSEALTLLWQTTIVVVYQESFEKLFHRVDDLSKSFLIGCFIAGLRDEIQLEVKIKHSTILVETIGLSRLIKENNQLQQKITPSFPNSDDFSNHQGDIQTYH